MITSPVEAIRRTFGVEERPNLAARYNVAPTQEVPIVRCKADGDGRELAVVRWGLIPHWADDPAIGNRLINARAESVATKPSFRDSFRRRRCLVVADGFYEWQRQARGPKQPYAIREKDHALFGFAGLWSVWRDPEGRPVETCTIITTDANPLVEPIHNRMPVIVRPEDYDRWLDPESDFKSAEAVLSRPLPADRMVAYRISTKVNNVRNEGPDLIAPADRQQQLL